MADSIRDLVVKISLEDREFKSKIGGMGTALGGVTLGLGALAAAATAAGYAIVSALPKGESVNNVSAAFGRLQAQFDRTASVSIANLREATQGMMSDFELMRSANNANLLGITPELFEELAAGAEKLGEAVDVELGDSLQALVEGFGRANERSLQRLRIQVDAEKAEREYAKSLGVTRDQLSETGKREAFRIEALKIYRQQLSAVSTDTVSANDALTKVAVAFENITDKVKAGLDANPKLAESFDRLAETIKNFDPTIIVKGIELIGVTASTAGKLVADFARGLDVLFNTSDVAKLNNIGSSIDDVVQEINKLQQISTRSGLFRGKGGERLSGPDEQALLRYSQELQALVNQREELTKSHFAKEELVKTTEKLGEVTKNSTATTTGNRDALINLGKAEDEAAKKADELNKKIAEQAKALDDLVSQSKADIAIKGLVQKFEAALTSSDFDLSRTLLGEIETAVKDSRFDELSRQFSELIANDKTGEQLEKILTTSLEAGHEKALELIKLEEEARKQSFEDLFDVYADIFTTTITGNAQDFEEIMGDAAKRFAIGFGAQMLAALTQGTAIGDLLAGATDAKGLGKNLATSLIGSLGLGSLGGSSSGPPSTPVIVGAGWSSSGSAATSTTSQGLIGGLSGTQLAVMGGLAAAPFVLPKLGDWFDDLFGGGDPERLARESMLDKLKETSLGEDLIFKGIRGNKKLSAGDYNVDLSNPFAGDAISLTSGLANAITGGGKLGEDLNGIFANAIKDGKNFNEVLIQARSLMEQTGYTAEQAKKDLTAAFLDSTEAVGEFANDLKSLNLLAQEDLVGPNSVADALGIVGDEATTNREKLKAIGLAFKEMSDLGIKSSADIHGYLIDKFGPDVASMFDQLTAAGIDTFDEVKNASADQIALIFSILEPLKDEFAAVFSLDDAAGGIEDASDRIVDGLSAIREEAAKTREEMERLGNMSVNGGSSSLSRTRDNAARIDPNQRNFRAQL